MAIVLVNSACLEDCYRFLKGQPKYKDDANLQVRNVGVDGHLRT
jgi:hypothetical protein